MLKALKKKTLQTQIKTYIKDDALLYWSGNYVFFHTYCSNLGYVRALKDSFQKNLKFSSSRLSVKTRKLFFKDLELKLIECPLAPFVFRGYKGEGKNPPVFAELDHRFEMSETLITKELFAAVVGDAFAKFCNYNDPQIPMCNLEYSDIIAFCDNLSDYFGLERYYDEYTKMSRSVDYSRKGFRLPSEMEWEYAANALSNTKWAGTNEEHLVDQYAVYDNRSLDEPRIGLKPKPIKTKLPNNFGFYDMSGNLREFCIGPQQRSPTRFITRGGSYEDTLDEVLISYRTDKDINTKTPTLGLRIARTL